MKSLRTCVLCAALALCSLPSLAQNEQAPVNEPNLNKPRLFSALPDKISVNIAAFSDMLNSSPGRPALLSLSADQSQRFEGEVVSNSSKYDNKLQTVVIRSTNFSGARFTLSKVVNPDGQVVYRGRIISFAHGDLYELENQAGEYKLVKKNFYDLVNE